MTTTACGAWYLLESGFGEASFGVAENVVIVLFEVVRLVVVDQVALGLH